MIAMIPAVTKRKTKDSYSIFRGYRNATGYGQVFCHC